MGISRKMEPMFLPTGKVNLDIFLIDCNDFLKLAEL
jgi:hypothetical protein